MSLLCWWVVCVHFRNLKLEFGRNDAANLYCNCSHTPIIDLWKSIAPILNTAQSIAPILNTAQSTAPTEHCSIDCPYWTLYNLDTWGLFVCLLFLYNHSLSCWDNGDHSAGRFGLLLLLLLLPLLLLLLLLVSRRLRHSTRKLWTVRRKCSLTPCTFNNVYSMRLGIRSFDLRSFTLFVIESLSSIFLKRSTVIEWIFRSQKRGIRSRKKPMIEFPTLVFGVVSFSRSPANPVNFLLNPNKQKSIRSGLCLFLSDNFIYIFLFVKFTILFILSFFICFTIFTWTILVNFFKIGSFGLF